LLTALRVPEERAPRPAAHLAAQVYGAPGSHTFKRDGFTVLQVLEESGLLVDDGPAMPGWMSDNSLWLFAPDSSLRSLLQRLLASRWYRLASWAAIGVSILGVFWTGPVGGTKHLVRWTLLYMDRHADAGGRTDSQIDDGWTDRQTDKCAGKQE
jgi:hypothetical protein